MSTERLNVFADGSPSTDTFGTDPILAACRYAKYFAGPPSKYGTWIIQTETSERHLRSDFLVYTTSMRSEEITQYETGFRTVYNAIPIGDAGFTEHKDARPQACPCCKEKMIVESDSFGGGSHYWTHFCPICRKAYSFSTYEFELSHLDPFAYTG